MLFLQSLRRPKFGSFQPDRAISVIGDLHGRSDLLVQVIERLGEQQGPEATLIFVGDYIDRGENSAEVLRLLQTLQNQTWDGDVICLKGNHELMLLDFIDMPEETGGFWLQNGGASTLASFGIRPPEPLPDALCAAREALCDAMGPQSEAWLRALPLSHRSGNIFIAHAGANPHSPLDQQQENDLLWGHPDFPKTPRRDGVWVAHGHVICESPSAQKGRISVDTGAYATHKLTAALISEGECRFLST